MTTPTADWDATLALARWRQARREPSADAQLVATGLALLAPPLAQLDAAARALNVSWSRLTSEAAQLAVFLLTRARRDDGGGSNTTAPAALRLLRLALDAFAVRAESNALALPTNASNLLLAAVADVLEKEDERDALLDVKRVLLFLFGMADDSSSAAPPSFQLYKPPTNVFSDFVHRALVAIVTRLSSDGRAAGDDTEREYVAIARAVVVVYQELQRSQVNKRKVFLAVAKTSLRDLIGYRHALVQLQARGIAGVTSVVDLLDRIVVDALFDAEHIRGFDGALVHTSIWRQGDQLGDIVAASGSGEEGAELEEGENKSKKRRKKNDGVSTLVSYQKYLFDELKAFLSDDAVPADLKSSVGGFMQMLVGAFAVRIRAAAHSKIEDTKTDLKTSKKRAATVIATASTTFSPFKFWSEMCAVSFLVFKQLEPSGDAADALALLAKLYKSLFQALCDADVYRVTEDTDEREQFEAMETILVAFLNLVNRSAVDSASPPTSLLHVQEQCHIVSCAVRCSPNLVNSSLVPIFEILGGHIVASKALNSNHCEGVLLAGSACLSDLVASYESMRLLDKFLEASMSTEPSKHVSEGLYALFSHPQCESALRRAFMTLPPGQLEVLWTLFTKQLAVKCEHSKREIGIFSVGLVRFVFQMFLQEVHVTPQNKAKVMALATKTHEMLFAPVIFRLVASAKAFVISPEDREVFGLFGELLSFYDILADVRSETFDGVLTALKSRSVTSAMKALLSAKAPNNKGNASRKHTNTQARSLDSTGIIKICIFWLRKASSIRYAPSEIVTVSESDLLSIALLVVDHVIECKCWDAVAFYLPELLEAVPAEKAEVLLKELMRAYLAEEIQGVVDGPATRVVREAAFYEIRTFQAVAPTVFATLAAENGVDSPIALELVTHLFRFLHSLPDAYLELSSCGDLLANALALHEASTTSASVENEQAAATMVDALLRWLQTHFKRITLAVASKPSDVRKKVDAGVRFIFLQAAGSGRVSADLLGDVLSFYLDDGVGTSQFVGELFASLILKKATPSANLVRSTLVVEALANLRLGSDKSVGAHKVTAEESKFIETLVSLLKQEDGLNDSASFAVLGALVKYRAAIASSQNHHKQAKALERDQVQQLHAALSSQLRAALAKSMAVVVSDERPAEAWRFFTSFCEHFGAFRPSVTIETYGCLLAVALTLVSKSSLTEVESVQAVKALQAVVANSSKDEYRLLLSTVTKEVSAPESSRVVSALKALSLLLQGERKLSAARRESLSQHKDEIVGALVHNFSRSLAASRSDSSIPLSCSEQAELCVWNLQVFVLFFTKAELFTWKTHELAHIFIGFQPLLAAVSHWQTRKFSSQQVHQIWMLSYTLLLRIVRHHFASLVNGTPHIIQAANALLEMLVLASTESTGSGATQAAQFAEWSSNLARLYGYMKEHDSQLRKHVVYLMLAYLVSVTRDNLSLELQQKLRPGVFSLLDICSLFEKEQLYAALDSTGKSLLKSLDTSYKLTHRYAGKV